MTTKRRTPNHLIVLTCTSLLFSTQCCANQLANASLSSRKSKSLTRNTHQVLGRRRAFVDNYCNVNIHVRSNSSSINGIVKKQLRGGAILSNRQTKASSPTEQKSTQSNIFTIASIAILSTTILFSILNWETLILSLSTFFDREKFRTMIIDTLNSISSKGTRGLLLYTFGFVFWETCGLPTSVVETAAGMAFGFKNGLLCSFIGKTFGSIVAFSLGRSLCHSFVKKQLQNNELLGLMEKSVARNPIRSALVMRYSPFPQLIKNFGLSMMEPVTLSVFLAAIVVHGFPFSILWAALGDDSSMRLRADEIGETIDANWVLNGTLVFVTVFGFVISPLITGWWISDLRNENTKMS